jgi:hypothetical protein
MSPPSRVRDLATLGWDDVWSAAFEPYRDECLTPGRIAVPHRGEYDVVTAETGLRAKIAPQLAAADRRALVEPQSLVGPRWPGADQWFAVTA